MDDEVIGFGVQIRETGRKSFTLDYTFEGRRRRLYIGDFRDWSVVAAREQAKQIKRELGHGLGFQSELKAAYKLLPNLTSRKGWEFSILVLTISAIRHTDFLRCTNYEPQARLTFWIASTATLPPGSARITRCL